MLAPRANVMRGGERMAVAHTDLVPGDIVPPDAGDKVPADLRLIEMAGLRMEEAMLTGESAPVRKDTHPLGARQDCPLRSGQPGGCEPANRCAYPGLAGRQIIASTRLQSLVIMVVLDR